MEITPFETMVYTIMVCMGLYTSYILIDIADIVSDRFITRSPIIKGCIEVDDNILPIDNIIVTPGKLRWTNCRYVIETKESFKSIKAKIKEAKL